MKKIALGIGIVCFGAVLGIFGHSAYESHYRKWPFGAPSDTPVVVRGGSVTAFSMGWTERVPGQVYSETLTGAANTIYLDGIDKTGKKSPKDYTAPNLSGNWQISLTFRNQDLASGKGPTQLQICTKLTNNSCDPDLTGSLGNSVYLVGDQHDQILHGDFDRKGSNVRLRTKLSNCDTASTFDAECDHIADISVSGIPGLGGPYHCVDGSCDVGITHQ